MNAFTAYVATEHLFDLRREAEAEHLAQLARAASSPDDGDDAGVGRLVGRSARRLSSVLAAFATRVDPVDTRRAAAAKASRKGRPLTA